MAATDVVAGVGIGVLGPVGVEGDTAALGRRDRVVLAALATRPGVAVPAEVLADVLWGDDPPVSWAKVVQGCVVRLRKVLGQAAIETVPHGYRLVVTGDGLDSSHFERLVRRGQELLALGDPDRASFVIDEALGLWRGEAFAELDDWDVGRVEARRLEELRRDAEDLLLDARLQAGQLREVLASAQAAVVAEPLRERRWGLLALAQYQAGRQGDALRTLRQARRVLASELGLDPGHEMVALENAILRQDPSLVAAVALPEPSQTCPYLGLVPYDVGDTEAFFGRDDVVSECLRRLADVGVLIVVGPSGSGKSSLVRAGVVAGLERDGHRAVVVTPGDHPLDALTALPRTGALPVLVVDQCEEAITLCTDTQERTAFFTALAAHAEMAPLVVALRADRLGELAAHPAFARLVERGLHLLTAMDHAQLRTAIEGPAQQAGLLIEPGLVDLLVREVENEPGALPLLSHALRLTWQQREGRTLTVAGYQASGGIRGAVAQSAEQVYEQTPVEQRQMLRDLLMRLVAPSPDGDPVRSRVPRRIVAADPEHEALVELLISARLLTSDQDVVELAHEALARAWPRLRGWLDDDVEGQRIWRHVAEAANAWEAMGRAVSELYRGPRLARAVDWQAQTGPGLTAVEQEFLATSQQVADAARTAARRRRRVLISGLAAGLAVATVLAAVAVVNQRRADESAETARARELSAAALAALDTDPRLAKLLALASAEVVEPTIDSLSVLHQTLAADPVLHRYTWPDQYEAGWLAADLHPDGTRMVAANQDDGQHLEVYDFSSGAAVWSVDTTETAVVFDLPVFANDGQLVVAGFRWDPPPDDVREPPRDDLGAHLWDADTGTLVDRVDLGECGGVISGMSDTHLLVQIDANPAPACWQAYPDRWRDMSLELVDLETGQRNIVSEHTWHGRARLSGDGHFIAFTEDPISDDGPEALTVVADTTTGERVLEIDPFTHEGIVGDYGEVRALSHDGSLLVVGDRPMAVWDVADGRVIATFNGHSGEAYQVRFDGDTVYSLAEEGNLLQWDARSGVELARHPALGVGTVSTGDGRVLVADARAHEAILLDTAVRGEVGATATCGGFILAQTLNVAGEHAVVSESCPDGLFVTSVIELGEQRLTHTLPGHAAQGLAISPDGTRVVRQESPDRPWAGSDRLIGPPTVRSLTTGELLTEFDGVCTDQFAPLAMFQPGCSRYPQTPFPLWNRYLVWSPDSAMVAAGSADEPPGVAVWDSATGELLHADDLCTPGGLSFSPDATRLVVSCWDALRTLSTDTWEEVGLIEGLAEYRLTRHTPDGSSLVGFEGQSLLLSDAETLETKVTIPRIHEGLVKSWSLSPDGSQLATGSSDGLVKVWDLTSREAVHEIYLGQTQVQGVAFVDDLHLAVAPQDGGVYVYTLDPDELRQLVRKSLTRGFTTNECARYNFGDNCPTLDEHGNT